MKHKFGRIFIATAILLLSITACANKDNKTEAEMMTRFSGDLSENADGLKLKCSVDVILENFNKGNVEVESCELIERVDGERIRMINSFSKSETVGEQYYSSSYNIDIILDEDDFDTYEIEAQIIAKDKTLYISPVVKWNRTDDEFIIDNSYSDNYEKYETNFKVYDNKYNLIYNSDK